MVLSRCAMTNVVLSFINRSKASWICISVTVSTEEVASSRMRILACFRRARAMEMRCFCPTESLTPRSPTTVSRPSGSLADKLLGVGQANGLPQLLLRRVGPAKEQVVTDRPVKQERVLAKRRRSAPAVRPGKAPSHRSRRSITLPARHVIKSGNERDQGRLSSARRSHQGDGLAWCRPGG